MSISFVCIYSDLLCVDNQPTMNLFCAKVACVLSLEVTFGCTMLPKCFC